MLYINSFGKKILSMIIISSALILSGCSNDENPVESNGNPAKVSGRISATSSSSNVLGKASATEAVEGATVVLAQVQVDGSLKTVSTQSVQTDVNGKFVIETNLNEEKNLVVVAEKASAKWKAIVSAKVKSGATVYAPPLNTESTAQADIYIKLVGQGKANEGSESDLKWFINSQAAAQIHGNADAEAKVIDAIQAQNEATVKAAGNSYFGLTNAQIQAMMKAKTDASAKLDEELYMNGDSDSGVESAFNNYENSVIAATASSNINASTYAGLMRIGLSAYTNASASMQSQARFATSKSFYLRYALALNYAMKQQFQAAGASSAQVNSVNSAGVTLYSSIKNSTDADGIANAFAQYQSSIKSELKLTLSSHATAVDSVDATINAANGAKVILSSSINFGVSLDVIVNAYVTFFNAVKTASQTAFAGATSTQASAAAQILILATVN